MEVHLVADTNLFFECRSLEELPWANLGYDPVVIVLTKPVLDEIDKHKKATGRTRSRALEIFSRVRNMLESSAQEVAIQPMSPKVLLRVKVNAKPDPALKEDLDYTRTDEKLIGITSTLHEDATGHSVKLFTDDTGPAAIANSFGVPYLMIEKDWRRPPSESTEEKRIKDLEKDLATYRSQEPKISISVCEPANESNVVEITKKIPTPLTEAEVSELLALLRHKHPLVTDFTPPPPSSTKLVFGEITTIEYAAPAEDSIANYRDVLYPQWIEQCRNILNTFHKQQAEIDPAIALCWSMSNDGTRPASQVRVEFEAKGPLVLRRLPIDDKNSETTGKSTGLTIASTSRLPSAPKPPPFQTQVTSVPPLIKSKLVHAVDVSALRATTLGSSGLAELVSKSLAGSILPRSIETLNMPPPYIPRPRNPEDFYYDHWPTDQKVTKGALTCQLWRHQSGEQTFEFDVLFTKPGEVRGAIECKVHAENLTAPAQATVVVRRTIEPLNLMESATALVEACS